MSGCGPVGERGETGVRLEFPEKVQLTDQWTQRRGKQLEGRAILHVPNPCGLRILYGRNRSAFLSERHESLWNLNRFGLDPLRILSSTHSFPIESDRGSSGRGLPLSLWRLPFLRSVRRPLRFEKWRYSNVCKSDARLKENRLIRFQNSEKICAFRTGPVDVISKFVPVPLQYSTLKSGVSSCGLRGQTGLERTSGYEPDLSALSALLHG